MKKRVYRAWKKGDVGYHKNGVCGEIEIREHHLYPVELNYKEAGSNRFMTFTLDGRYMATSIAPSLSFLPNEQSMPFDEVEEMDQLPEKYAVRPDNMDQAVIVCDYFESITGIPLIFPSFEYYHCPLLREPVLNTFRRGEVAKGYTEISFEDWQRLVQPTEPKGSPITLLTKPVNDICKDLRTLADPEEEVENIYKRLLNEVYEIYVDRIAEISEKIDHLKGLEDQRNALEKLRLMLRNRI